MISTPRRARIFFATAPAATLPAVSRPDARPLRGRRAEASRGAHVLPARVGGRRPEALLAERRLGLFDRLGDCFRDTSCQDPAVRSCRSLAGQRVLGRKDLNGYEGLRKDRALGAALDSLGRDPSRARALGRAAQLHARAHFDERAVFERILRAYRELPLPTPRPALAPA